MQIFLTTYLNSFKSKNYLQIQSVITSKEIFWVNPQTHWNLLQITDLSSFFISHIPKNYSLNKSQYLYREKKHNWLTWNGCLNEVNTFIYDRPKTMDSVQQTQLVGFYGISTLIGYLMPNHVYIYIKYLWYICLFSNGISTFWGFLMPNPFF